jgi:uncharacterized protein (DUF2147 family)
MRKPVLSGIFFLAALGAAHAAEPTGEWRDEDGKATIRIVDCNARLWGVVASEAIPGGVDSKNPDKAKRSRPILGMPVLLNMKKAEDEKDKWEGKVYNAENGKTYEASIQLKSPNALRVEGCLVWPLCGGQTWARVESAAAAPGASAKAGATAPATGSTGSTGAKTAHSAPKSTQPSAQPSPFPTPIGSAPKAPKGSTTAKAPAAATTATAAGDPATAEICSLPEIAGASH